MSLVIKLSRIKSLQKCTPLNSYTVILQWYDDIVLSVHEFCLFTTMFGGCGERVGPGGRGGWSMTGKAGLISSTSEGATERGE